MHLRLMPWEYGVRNLWRRPARTALTLFALTVVITLVMVLVGFVRGLEGSLSASGDASVVMVYALGAENNVENSSIAAMVPTLLAASVSGIEQRYGIHCVSPELFMGTRVVSGNMEPTGFGLVRGVTAEAPLVRRSVRVVQGQWPGAGEVMVGRLAATRLGYRPDQLSMGRTVEFEGRRWQISGHFTADGSALEAEIWCPLEDLQHAARRQDLSLVAVLDADPSVAGDIDLFCKSRLDLELQSISEVAYYQALQQYFRSVRTLAWMIAGLVAGAGLFAALNMMHGAVGGRVRELATLQAVGFRRRAVVASLLQEGALLAAAASVLAGLLALALLNGIAVRFTMGAFALRIDSLALLVGCGVGLAIGILGTMPPSLAALRRPPAEALKAI